MSGKTNGTVVKAAVDAAPAEHLHQGPPLSAEDWKILDLVEYYHETGREVHDWWKKTNFENTYSNRFAMLEQFDPEDTNFGFIDKTSITGNPSFPVVGTVQQMLYHRPKHTGKVDVEWIKAQVREFMLRYFMRVASYSDPQIIPVQPEEQPPFYLKPFVRGRQGAEERRGWDYQQMYFKHTEDGSVGRFTNNCRRAIVDVRELTDRDGPRRYDWIVMKVNIFEFALSFPPFTDGPQASLPFRAVAHVVMSPDFILDEDDPQETNPNNPNPEDKVVGRYGWGYSFIQPPRSHSLLAYGPEGLGPAFMSFHFDVHESGDVRLYNYFAANQPTSLVRIPLSPFEWGFELADQASFGLSSRLFGPLRRMLRELPYGDAQLKPVFSFVDLANFLSNGRAARELLISREQVLKIVMAIHFMDTYDFQKGTLGTWSRFSDWTDPTRLPEWVKTGREPGLAST